MTTADDNTGASPNGTAQDPAPVPAISSDEAAAAPLPRRRHGRVFLYLILFIATSIWLGRFCYLRITLRPTPRPEYWEQLAMQLDPPPHAWRHTSKSFDDFAGFAWRAMPGRQAITSILIGDWGENREATIAAGEIFISKEFIEARRAVVDAPAQFWPLDFTPSQAPLYQSGRYTVHLSQLLLAHSRWARESKNDLAATLEDWRTIFRLARDARRPRTLAGMYSEAMLHETAANEMLITAGEPHEPIDTAALASQIDEHLGPELKPSELLLGERYNMHSLLEHHYVREGGNWLDVSIASGLGWMSSVGSVSRLWNLASPLYYDLPTAKEFMDGRLLECDRLRTLLDCGIDPSDWSVFRPDEDSQIVLCGFRAGYFYTPRRIIAAQYYTRCAIDAALTRLALVEFHRSHQRYPERLEELLPDYLPRLPIDYADRKPLRYRLTVDGYVLYSLGLDGTDDGGMGDAYFYTPHPDVVFSNAARSAQR